MRLKRTTVRALAVACELVDELAYRPAVVKATVWLPSWWQCQLGRLSVRLDERWGTGYWGESAGPVAVCGACRRRAAWLYVGGYADDEEFADDPPDPDEYMAWQRVEVCGWCTIDFEPPIRNAADLDRALSRARARSIAWRWRWRPRGP